MSCTSSTAPTAEGSRQHRRRRAAARHGALSHDGRQLYVAASNANRIEVVDLATRKVGRRPYHPAPTRSASRSARTARGSTSPTRTTATVSFLDIASQGDRARDQVGPEPEGMAVSPDGKLVICTSESASLAHFIDAATASCVDSLLVGTRPRDARVHAGRHGSCGCPRRARATIAVFDAATRQVMHTIDLDEREPRRRRVQAVGMVDDPRRQPRVRRARPRQPRRRDRREDIQADPLTHQAGQRTWGIALSPDENAALRRQRPFRRPHGHRPESGQTARPRSSSAASPGAWSRRHEASGRHGLLLALAPALQPRAAARSAPIPTTCRSPTARGKASRTSSPSWSPRTWAAELNYVWWAQRRGYVRNTLKDRRVRPLAGRRHAAWTCWRPPGPTTARPMSS